jgi:hypothetical protein
MYAFKPSGSCSKSSKLVTKRRELRDDKYSYNKVGIDEIGKVEIDTR